MSVSPELLTLVAGVILSLLFSYVPGVNTWYAAQSDEYKKLFMLILLAVTAGGIFALACGGVLPELFGLAVTCDQTGALGLVQAFLYALIANQSAYKLTPQTRAVKNVKLLADGAGEFGHGRG